MGVDPHRSLHSGPSPSPPRSWDVLSALALGLLWGPRSINGGSIYKQPLSLSISESRSVVSDSVTPWTIQSMEFSRLGYRSGQPLPSPGDLPNPGIEPTSPALQADSLPAEPPGKPKITGVGSLCLLQGIFPTQESNWSLLHGRRSLYQLSHQGSCDAAVPKVADTAQAQACSAG